MSDEPRAPLVADPAALGLAGFGLTLEITEILLFIGYFGGGSAWITWGGYLGVITALVAWYTSAAIVVNSMGPSRVLPVGGAIWPTSAQTAPVGRPAHA